MNQTHNNDFILFIFIIAIIASALAGCKNQDTVSVSETSQSEPDVSLNELSDDPSDVPLTSSSRARKAPPHDQAAQKDWSDMELVLLHLAEDIDADETSQIRTDIKKLLTRWLAFNTQKNAKKLSGLYDKTTYINGIKYTPKTYEKALPSLFKIAQNTALPRKTVTAERIARYTDFPDELWHIQAKFATKSASDRVVTLILRRRLLDNDESTWTILAESDQSTTSELIKDRKPALCNEKPNSCKDAACHILAHAPQFELQLLTRYLVKTSEPNSYKLIDIKDAKLPELVPTTLDDPAHQFEFVVLYTSQNVPCNQPVVDLKARSIEFDNYTLNDEELSLETYNLSDEFDDEIARFCQ